jgi:hypothetical protein
VSGRLLLWFGLLGAPLAWTAQLVVGYGASDAACGAAGSHWHLDEPAFQAVTFGLAAAVALGALAAALWEWRQAGDGRGRAHFMASGGAAVGVLFLLLILFTGAGVLSLDRCAR